MKKGEIASSILSGTPESGGDGICPADAERTGLPPSVIVRTRDGDQTFTVRVLRSDDGAHYEEVR